MFTKDKCLWVLISAILGLALPAYGKSDYRPLRVGCSVTLNEMQYPRLKALKEAGIDCVEIALTPSPFSREGSSDEAIEARMAACRQAADSAGIEIWSIHMPFGKTIDLSQSNETIRQKSVALQLRILDLCRVLRPHVVLFHPSWYLGHNERPQRMAQLVRSIRELHPRVKKLGAILVIENMLGYELVKNEQYERPLGRTVEEVQQIMKQMPRDVYSAIDMNHIDHPERLIRAMGKRLKSVHISDGNGRAECHYMPNPCSGKGDNDWNQILLELYRAGYTGPFMYEVGAKEFDEPQELYDCYQNLYQTFIESTQTK